MEQDLIELPWPPKELSPNRSLGKWQAKHHVGKKYKNDAYLLTLAAGYKDLSHYERLTLHVVFHPPSARHGDIDNMLASLKKGIDGISAATGINDCNFDFTIKKGQPEKGGRVAITITGQTNEGLQRILADVPT